LAVAECTAEIDVFDNEDAPGRNAAAMPVDDSRRRANVRQDETSIDQS
jgi:hypothetical protein